MKHLPLLAALSSATVLLGTVLRRRRSARTQKQDPLSVAVPVVGGDDTVTPTARLPELDAPPRIVVLTTAADCEAAMLDLLAEKPAVLGLDAEWKPHRKGEQKNKLALLQLSSPTTTYLIHLFVMGSAPPALAQVLQDPSIIKAGVGIAGDKRKLHRDWGLIVHGVLDLQSFTAFYHYAPGGLGLKAMTALILRRRIAKSREMQMSNWETHPLSAGQVKYGATDSWAGLLIFQELYARHGEAQSERDWASRQVDAPLVILKKSGELVERKSRKKGPKAPKPVNPNKPKKEYRKMVHVYDNCRLLNPDGTLLCLCSQRKIDWYIAKGLAEKVTDGTGEGRLKFQPKYQSHVGDQFYLENKANKCVICGSTDSFSRFHVVPVCYRKFFPDSMKSHSSHDVVLLCERCHEVASRHAEDLKDVLADEYGVPTDNNHTFRSTLGKVRSAARAMIKARKSGGLPRERLPALYAILQEHYGKEEISDAEIDAAGEISKDNSGFKTHGELLLEKIDDLQAFSRRWRQHFLERCRPQYLPVYWSTDHVDHPRGVDVVDAQADQAAEWRELRAKRRSSGPAAAEEGGASAGDQGEPDEPVGGEPEEDPEGEPEDTEDDNEEDAEENGEDDASD